MNQVVSNTEQGELWEELKVDGHWFHVVRSMIMGNKIAEMGVNAWAVYCVLKAYTQLDTGKTWPSQDTIAKHLDLSVDTVARATDRLIELKIIEKRKVGRRNEYSLVESVPLRNRADDVVAVGTDTYSPANFMRYINELKQFAKTGELANGSNVRIVLNVNFIQQGDHGVVNIHQVDLGDDNPLEPAVLSSGFTPPPKMVHDIKAKLLRDRLRTIDNR